MIGKAVEPVDPRADRWVSFGLWPDCPDCQGLLSVASEPLPRNPREFGMPKEQAINPCPGCNSRNESMGIEMRQDYFAYQTSVPFGTWPDCSDCRGTGGAKYESSFDGHRSDYDWANCKACQERTAEYLRVYPAELDLLLRRQTDERKPLVVQLGELKALLQKVSSELHALKQRQAEELAPYSEKVKADLGRKSEHSSSV